MRSDRTRLSRNAARNPRSDDHHSQSQTETGKGPTERLAQDRLSDCRFGLKHRAKKLSAANAKQAITRLTIRGSITFFARLGHGFGSHKRYSISFAAAPVDSYGCS